MPRKILSAVLLLVLVFLRSPLQAADSRSRQIDALFSQFDSNNAPGLAVLVVKNDKVFFRKGYGLARLSSHEKISPETNFRLASVTKQFTAMAIMLLVHDGKLRYDDTLTKVFPDFPEYGSSITIRNLLNHTAGLKDYEDLWEEQHQGVPPDQVPQIKDAEVLELLKRQSTTKFQPGTKWEYSNTGYAMLAMVVERTSGKSFGQFLQDRIFTPLKMDHTVAFEQGKNTVTRRAYGYSKADDSWRETDQSPTSAVLGDGGIYSSVDDLARWDHGLAHNILLSEEEMRPAFTPVKVPDGGPRSPDGSPTDYGFGWFLGNYKGHERVWHYGSTIGFRTAIQRFTNDRVTIILLCNRADVNPTELAMKIADLMLPANK